ncbi:MAG: DUF4910 domain-containing protein [Anaerolineae bacterium]|nr:DUF4910 domain-containing protein [Anaerolineae bacterium]
MESENHGVGREMFELVGTLFPICRSITGNGVRETLRIIQEHIPITLHEVPSGAQVLDWTVPREWNIRDAYFLDEDGSKYCDFKEHNLHIMSYSVPVDETMSLEELDSHLYSLPDHPDAIPYITSFYQERWGFGIPLTQREQLKPGQYRVFIDSDLKEGHLTYADLVIPGESEREVFLSTYICHPSMANNELSGPALLTYLGKWITKQPRRYTYRLVFVPGTIGPIAYLSQHLETLKRNVIAGFNLTCVGDDRAYSYVASRYGDSYADKVIDCVLRSRQRGFNKYSFLDRGSDERQYCAPGVDLPLVSFSRSKVGTYPEYHTSLDNLDIVSPAGFEGGYEVMTACFDLIEKNARYRIKTLAEPQLGKRGLHHNLGTRSSLYKVKDLLDFTAYADGTNDLIAISDLLGVPVWDLYPIVEKLKEADLLEEMAIEYQ